MGFFDIFREKKEVPEPLTNPPELLAVKLFFIAEPVVDDESIEKSLNKRFDKVELTNSDDSNKNSRHYLFSDYEIKFEEGTIPAQGTMFIPDEEGVNFE